MRKKTIQCSQCGKSSPVGSAHNARTCTQKNPKNFTRTLKEKGATSSDRYSAPSTTSVGNDNATPVADAYRKTVSRTQLRDPSHALSGREGKVQRFAKIVGAEKNIPGVMHVMEVADIAVEEDADGALKMLSARQGTPHASPILPPLSKGHTVFVVLTTNGESCYMVVCVNEQGYVDSYNNNPAFITTPDASKSTFEWYRNGQPHNLRGPAYINGDTKTYWVNGDIVHDTDLCEKASSPITKGDEFYELCSHESYPIRQIAAANPNCPEEWRTLVALTE